MPGPLKFLRLLRDGPIESFTRDHFELPIVISKTVLGPIAYVSAPSALRRVLVENASNYRRAAFQQKILASCLGMGLLTAEDRQWRLQRRLSGSMFTPKVVASFGRAMAEAARGVVERWRAHPEGTEIDIANELACATIDILGTTLFSEGVGPDSARLHPALLRILDTAGRFDLLDALQAPRWLPRIGPLLARPSLALLTGTAEAMIAARYSRRASAAHSMPEDLITVLLDGRDHGSGRSLSRREIRDNIITFIAVGSETSANALTWALYLLSLDPEWRERVEAETDRELPELGHRDGRSQRLSVTRAVIEESMRLYPPVPITTRQAIASDRLLGHDIPPGSMIIVSPWLIHRHRLLWQEAELFDPARFLPGSRERIDRFSYLPFGAGPRACVGGAFAMQEMIILLATIVRNFRLALVPSHHPWPMNHVTLRPRGGLPMIIHRRR